MTYDHFHSLLMVYKQTQLNIRELYQVGVDLYESKYALSDKIYEMFTLGFTSTYTEEGFEWIEWFIFENDWGLKNWSSIPSKEDVKAFGARDKDGNAIAYDIPSLYQLLESDYKL